MEAIVKEYPYLKGIPIKSYFNEKPTVLIGANNWNIAVPLRIREGRWNQPIATKTRIGWLIQGPSHTSQNKAWLNIHGCDCKKKYEDLHQLVKESFHLEDPGAKVVLSEEDSKVLYTLKTTCQNIDGRYKVGLLEKMNAEHCQKATTMHTSAACAFRRNFIKTIIYDASFKNK